MDIKEKIIYKDQKITKKKDQANKYAKYQLKRFLIN
jgi:hypothetical protein